MDNQDSKPRELTQEEAQKLDDGLAIREMTQTRGWKVFEGWLKSRAFHSWVDPRETKSKEEWDWQELNAFHSHDVANQLLLDVDETLRTADELENIKAGKDQPVTPRL